MPYGRRKRILSSTTGKVKRQTTKVILAWNQFAKNAIEAASLLYESKLLELRNLVEDHLILVCKVVSVKEGLVAVFPFVVFLICYFFYRPVRSILKLDHRTPNHEFLPALEVSLFGFLPHQLLGNLHHPVLDVLTALPYLLHFPLLAFYVLYVLVILKDRKTLLCFCWLVGCVSLTSVTLFMVAPTAPPWFADHAYTTEDGQVMSTGLEEGGFHRVDRMLNTTFFHNLYTTSPVRFGACPSMHVAWPACIMSYRPWFGRRFAATHVLWIAFSAMYSHHHYAVDVLASIVIVAVFQNLIRRGANPFRIRYSPLHSASTSYRGSVLVT